MIGAALMAMVGALTPVGAALAAQDAARPGDAPGVLLAVVCGALLYSDLLHRHLSLPFQATALLLALARLREMSPADTHVRLVLGAGLGLLWLLLAAADRRSSGSARAGLGDASAMALVGLVAGANAPGVVIAGMLPPLLLVLARRVGAREPQPLAGWLLAALLLGAPWTWRLA